MRCLLEHFYRKNEVDIYETSAKKDTTATAPGVIHDDVPRADHAR
eukprot:COSAG01_NODE_68029_length_265_cov_0.716867_1_plen_44_part_10